MTRLFPIVLGCNSAAYFLTACGFDGDDLERTPQLQAPDECLRSALTPDMAEQRTVYEFCPEEPQELRELAAAEAGQHRIFIPLVFGSNPPPLTGCGGERIPPVGANFNLGFELMVVDLVNQERAAAGLGALQLNPDLADAARYHAVDLARDNYFSHDTHDVDASTGALVFQCSTWDRIANYYNGANGENIAAGYSTPASVVAGWMASPGHKANILNPDTEEIGVGFYQGEGDFGYYWVQNFGNP